MLSENTIAIVKSTAPVLEEHGETLTRHFYKRMFTHNPEVAPFFNSANQAGGQQQKALAAAICAYAANIDNLEVLGNAVELIAQKHVSLQIKPEHYPIVGENLLESIKEVLGDAATPEIIDAWAEAYGFLTDILTGREAQIYDEQVSQTGGWEGFKNFRIDKKEKESAVITSFYLKPEDNAPLPTFKPGQYITLRVPDASGTSTTMRSYSLSDKPGRDWLRISVKRETGQDGNPDGYVSTLLHDKMEVGDTLDLAATCGEFFLDTTEHHPRPLVLLAGGVGITPLISMLQSALDAMPERKIIFVHASINEEVQAFRDTLDHFAEAHDNLTTHYCYSAPKKDNETSFENTSFGFVTAELIESLVPERDADYYFCGPKPFMVNIYHELLGWGIPPNQVHFEFFGPRQELEQNPKKRAA
jgi:nitric oxide dioxygenase